MKTWKKIVGLTALTGVALGALAYFAKKKSLEEDFCNEFDEAFDEFEDDADDTSEDDNETADAGDRNYVHIDLEATDTKTDTDDKAEDKETTDSETEETSK